MLKRLFDIIFSTIGLILLSPVLLLLAILIKIDSPGTVFYGGVRIGQFGKPFRMYKFRTMREDADNMGGGPSSPDDDPRITKIGSYLRNSKLNEIPQLINVLKGDGPNDLREKSIHMSGIMLEMIGEKNGLRIAKEMLDSGLAYKKMKEIIKIQGGNLKSSIVNRLGRYKKEFYSNKSGIVKRIDNNKANSIGRVAGAPEDKFAGVLLNVKRNSKVRKNELIFTIFSSNKDRLKYDSSNVKGFIEVD